MDLNDVYLVKCNLLIGYIDGLSILVEYNNHLVIQHIRVHELRPRQEFSYATIYTFMHRLHGRCVH